MCLQGRRNVFQAINFKVCQTLFQALLENLSSDEFSDGDDDLPAPKKKKKSE